MRETVIAESPPCFICKHLHDRSEVINTHSCAAFPMGIPTEILIGYVEHSEVIDGQTGNATWERVVVGE